MRHVVPPRAAESRLALTRDELVQWGERFGAAMQPPLAVAISGELGAGKTTLVQAICRGAGVQEPVTSPTFSLVHQYRVPGASWPIYHVDLYRLRSAAELRNIGWDDIVAEHAVLLIEWPERAGARVPPHAVVLELEHDPLDPARRILLAG